MARRDKRFNNTLVRGAQYFANPDVRTCRAAKIICKAILAPWSLDTVAKSVLFHTIYNVHIYPTL